MNEKKPSISSRFMSTQMKEKVSIQCFLHIRLHGAAKVLQLAQKIFDIDF